MARTGSLVAAHGNIYSVSKRGAATVGRGFWVGVNRAEDADNPDVDDPKPGAVNTHVDMTAEEDAALDDDMSPEEIMARQGMHTLGKLAARSKEEARDFVDSFGKSTLTMRSVKVDLLLQDPEKLSEDELIKSAGRINLMLETASTAVERDLVANYAGRLARALRSTMEAREGVAKAILTKPSEEKEKKSKKSKTSKASEKRVNDKGKVGYKYEKKGDGKGPNSDRGGQQQPGAEGEGEDPQAAPVTPPPPVDAAPFAEALGISVENLESFAAKRDRKTFVDFFMKQGGDFAEKHKITPAYLGRLFDAVTHAQQPPQGAPQQPQLAKKPPAPGPAPAMPGAKPMATGKHGSTPLAKSIVVFTGATLDAKQLALVDLLKGHKAETVEDIRKCVQAHFALTEDASVRQTMTLLNALERQGLCAIYPPKPAKR